jgi:hypothetical protein
MTPSVRTPDVGACSGQNAARVHPAWQITIPFIVQQECRHAPDALVVWLTIARLICCAADQRGGSVGTRQIAALCGVGRNQVGRCITQLADRKLLHIVGHEPISGSNPRGLRPRRTYQIDWHDLEQRAIQALTTELPRTTLAPASAPASSDREARRPQMAPAPLPAHHPPPASPPDPPPLDDHPFDLWHAIHEHPRQIDLRLLTMLASTHDLPTGGYGLYWVSQAILTAALTHDQPTIPTVTAILERWRTDERYGSDKEGPS